ncbi:MAG: hypothetical protein DDG59_02595 [Anaerolineae bacterium]|nr:MAG: hypothetical protein DDG59_02595 [Anaerolineae bacterium]
MRRHPNGTFWGSFLVLNSLLFLPLAWTSGENALLPSLTPAPQSLGAALGQLFLRRTSFDPWRLSAELTLSLALWVGLRQKWRLWMRALLPLLYGLMLSYALYEAVAIGIYRLQPSVYAQYFLVRDALPKLLQHLGAQARVYLGVALGLLGLLFALWSVWRVLLDSAASPRLSPISRRVLNGLAAYSLLALALLGRQSAQPEAVLSSFTLKLWDNLQTSVTLYQRVHQWNDRPIQRLYDYSAFPLARKPHIYLVFVESYGSVLYQRASFTEPYRALLSELQRQLQAHGWQMATALSESPTWGGGSWLSYTSTLFGLRIDQHPQYLQLLNRYQTERYPSLSATLNDQGYHTVWLSALEDDLSEQGWQQYTRLLAIDQLIRYKDMGFIGPRYGWGPSPPDQWSLHWVHEELTRNNTRPLFLFTITQNSHYPFAPLPPLVQDWRSLNQPGEQPPAVDPQTLRLTTLRANYLEAITLELRLLTQWILDIGDANSIFILIGDHQPPAVSRRADGYATPIHILSQDAAFVQAFQQYGFKAGLAVDSLQPALRHEGFYSLFMRLLSSRYGINQLAQPMYLPKGIELDNLHLH